MITASTAEILFLLGVIAIAAYLRHMLTWLVAGVVITLIGLDWIKTGAAGIGMMMIGLGIFATATGFIIPFTTMSPPKGLSQFKALLKGMKQR